MATSVVVNGINGTNETLHVIGQYQIVTWDLDLTGRRLIDEICQIAAYTPESKFTQYVMPYRNLNPAAQFRHSIRIVNIGRYRAMKNSKTGKILKTKSEISALTDFITWLESVRGKEGVILMSYETRKVAPQILLEALSKYNLLETFSGIVKGFINGYNIAEAKCAKTVTSFSLLSLSRVLLDTEEESLSALDRARLAFQLVNQLYEPEESPDRDQGGGDGAPAKDLVQAISQFIHTVEAEQEELALLKGVLMRQSTLRPIFGSMVNLNRRERQRCSVQKQLIAESGLDYVQLETAYKESGKDSLSKLFVSKMTKANSKVIEELLTLLNEHFDPTLSPKPATGTDTKQIKKEKVGNKKDDMSGKGKEIKVNGKLDASMEEKSKTDDVCDDTLSSPFDSGASSPINRIPTDSDTSANTGNMSISPRSTSASDPAMPTTPPKQ